MVSETPYAVVIDKDPAMRLSLRHLLSVICGRACEAFSDLEGAQAYMRAEVGPSLFIIGSQVSDWGAGLRQLASKEGCVVVFLDRQENTQNAEEAFVAGADDVVRVPFTLREFALRLRARIGLLNDEYGSRLLQDRRNWDHEAQISGRAGLTDAEAQVAHILMSKNGEIVSRDVLSYAIDGRAWDYGDRKFDVHVAKIRKKFTSAFGDRISVQTVRSAGYVLTFDENTYGELLEVDASAPRVVV